MIRAFTILLVYLTMPITFAAAEEVWTCTYPGFSQDRRPVIVRYRQIGEFLVDDTWNQQYRIMQNNQFGIVASWSISTIGGLEQYPLLAERVGCSARTKVSPRSGAVLTLGRRLRGRLHDATQTTPVSALKRAQAPSARAEPADGCCSRGSSSRS